MILKLMKKKYTITTDPHFQDEKLGISPALSKELDRLYHEMQDKKNKKVIGQISALIEKYPKIPMLKNYLTVAYNIRGDYKKADEINRLALNEHPEYLFARINEASRYVENKEYEKALDLLGEQLDIQGLYPERNEFHFSEVTNYIKTTIRYLLAVDNIELAENRYNMLREIAPDDDELEKYALAIGLKRMEKGMSNWQLEQKRKIKPKVFKTVEKNNDSAAPVFNHQEIEYLYQYDLRISHQKLREILALPRESVIADLERVLYDAEKRYGYFYNLDYSTETHSFVIHALFLLKELSAKKSLSKILSFIEFEYEFTDFWFGDHKTENLWMIIYCLGKDNIPILTEFLLKSGIDTFSKLAVSTAISEMVLQKMVKLDEIRPIYTELLDKMLTANLKDNIIDSDFIAFAIGDCLDCKLTELQPIIKKLFDKGYVSHSIMGKYDEVEQYLNGTKKHYRDERKSLNIFELYGSVTSKWFGYTKKDKAIKIPELPPIINEKIGRNEPCPCGSGKKYKKCCWGKNN
jgi:hypothetical protein